MLDAAAQNIRDRIMRILHIYPKISPSMLQIGLGTSLPPAIWRPILDTMIAEGIVTREDVHGATGSGRQKSYEIIRLVVANSK